MTRQPPKLEALAAVIRDTLTEVPGVRAAYIFGSHAAGDATAGSDVDVAVLFDEGPGLDEVLSLERRLEEALGREVDLIDLGSASAFLALDVIRGLRVVCRDEDECDEFELYVLRRAGDLEPFERARREMLLGSSP